MPERDDHDGDRAEEPMPLATPVEIRSTRSAPADFNLEILSILFILSRTLRARGPRPIKEDHSNRW